MAGVFPVRQGATHKVVLGPAVAVGDGFTPTAALDISTADTAFAALHDNGTAVDISGYTFAAIASMTGYYHLTLQSGISNTVGHMTVSITDDSLMLPLRGDFVIIDTAPYDLTYADAAAGAASAAAVATEISDAWKVDATTEVSQGIPSATPTREAALMLQYMALRNKLDIDPLNAGKEIHNDAGTRIASKAQTDTGSVYSEAKMISGA